MGTIKALVIAPYKGLEEIVKQVAVEFRHFEIELHVANLEEGRQLVMDKSRQGIDIIISRGGTANFIRQVVDVPVIDIQVSGYDMLRVLTLVNGYPGKAAIVGFANISQGASTICNLLDMDIENLTIGSGEEVKETLLELKKKGYKLVIGDVVTVNAAKEVGLTGILITSGVEAVSEAFQEAERIYRLFDGLKRELALYTKILDDDDRGFIILDHKSKIIQQNHKARQIVVTQQMIDEINDVAKRACAEGKEQTVAIKDGQYLYYMIATPISLEEQVYCCVRLLEYSNKKKQEGVVIDTVNVTPTIAGTSAAIEKIRNQVELVAQDVTTPVWLTGDKGTGKEFIAKAIYKHSPTSHLPFIMFYCDLITEKLWEKLFDEDYFTSSLFGSIYLRDLHFVSERVQKKLFHILKGRTKGPRVIVSSHDDMIQRVSKGEFYHELYYLLSKVTIFLPSLKQRKEDMTEFVHLFISHFHARFGKQIVGIRPEALVLLSQYDWPGNIDQLKGVVEQLILKSSGYYIDTEDVAEILGTLENKSVANSNVGFTGTLEEIEKQIINQVLAEEGMNQSRAAERLGINRSTLWRKLKS